ncbi:MAG: hypothetical protein HY057_09040 [Rhodospirillales bacterium]|nr:hypothetical protein [Rhodospirillales bacterium]
MDITESIIRRIDEGRRAAGLLTVEETLALAERGNVVFDPFSTLIARAALIGTGNCFYPSVILLCADLSELTVGDENRFYPGTILAAEGGSIAIGHRNQFGEGGFIARANRPDARIVIGDRGRYRGGAAVYGQSRLGTGTQLLGQINADNCVLEAGEDHTHPDPDSRGGLLKGSGNARGLTVPKGHVIAGHGGFAPGDMRRQSFYHPKS